MEGGTLSYLILKIPLNPESTVSLIQHIYLGLPVNTSATKNG